MRKIILSLMIFSGLTLSGLTMGHATQKEEQDIGDLGKATGAATVATPIEGDKTAELAGSSEPADGSATGKKALGKKRTCIIL